jgi:hypothetical protein
MKRWTWQWLALLGLIGIVFHLWNMLWPVIPRSPIEIYHEPLYYDHFLVNIVEPGSPSIEHRL